MLMPLLTKSMIVFLIFEKWAGVFVVVIKFCHHVYLNCKQEDRSRDEVVPCLSGFQCANGVLRFVVRVFWLYIFV